ncbi:hypothetical protein BH24GEM3_BH24GEM3_10100 [soil metagenome]
MIGGKLQRLAERVARPHLVSLGPEEREQGVAPVQPSRRRDSEVDEQSDPLRLRQDGRQHPSLGSPQVESAEGTKLKHQVLPSLPTSELPRIYPRVPTRASKEIDVVFVHAFSLRRADGRRKVLLKESKLILRPKTLVTGRASVVRKDVLVL